MTSLLFGLTGWAFLYATFASGNNAYLLAATVAFAAGLLALVKGD